jgi:hypothetical protein
MRSNLPFSLCYIILVAAIAGCSSDPTSPGSESIAKAAGDAQTGVVGSALLVAPSVQVIDGDGNTVYGVSVVFAVTSGGGSVVSTSATTDSSGIATSGTWTLGSTAGVNSLTATAAGVGGSPVTFTATGVAVGALVKVSGDNQTGPAGRTLINPIVVRVTDATGNPIGGVSVNFSVQSGGGSLGAGGNQRQILSDASGYATMTWNLGSTAGPNTVLVFVTGNGVTGNNTTFTATGT